MHDEHWPSQTVEERLEEAAKVMKRAERPSRSVAPKQSRSAAAST